MKKIYVSVLIVLLAPLAFAQRVMDANNINQTNRLNEIRSELMKHNTPSIVKNNNQTPTVQTAGDIIWSEDFAGGIPAGWSNWGTNADSTSFLNNAWEYRGPATTPNASWGGRQTCRDSIPVSSTTRANGFVIFDSEQLDNGGTCDASAFGSGVLPCWGAGGGSYTGHHGYLQTDAINFSAATSGSLILSWTQRAHYFVGTSYIDISNDGGNNWTNLYEYTGLPETLLAKDQKIQLNITPYAQGQSDVRIRFHFEGAYWNWQIDDIVVTESYSTDLNIRSSYQRTLGDTLVQTTNYKRIPSKQAKADTVWYGAIWENFGATNINTGQAKMTVTNSAGGATYNHTWDLPSLASAQRDTIDADSFYIMNSGKGVYNFLISMLNGGISDSNTTNNYSGWSLNVTDSVYSRSIFGEWDANQFLDGENYGLGSLDPNVGIANVYEVFEADIASSVSFEVIHIPGSGSLEAVGSVVSVAVFDLMDNSNPPIPLASNSFYTIGQNDVVGGWPQKVTIPLDPTELQPGTYFVAVWGEVGAQPIIYTTKEVEVEFLTSLEANDVLSADPNEGWSIASGTGLPYIALNLNQCAVMKLTTSRTVDNFTETGIPSGAAVVTATNGTAPYTYAWSTGNNTSNITGIPAGDYTVTVTDANGCIKTTSVHIISVGMEEVFTAENVSLVPNPNNGQFNLKINNAKGMYRVQILDVLGKQISNDVVYSNQANNKSFDMTGMEKGVYFVVVKNQNNKEVVSRLVIQ